MSHRLLLALLALVAGFPAQSEAQVAVEVSYGLDRNVTSTEAESDGWLNGTVEWMFPSGLGLGIGTDHHFEGGRISPSDHQGWAIYLSASHEFPVGKTAPFVRGGIGLGRAPCEGDTCGDGVHLRSSAGVRIRIAEELRLSAEIGVSRVSRPFGGAGLSVRF